MRTLVRWVVLGALLLWGQAGMGQLAGVWQGVMHQPTQKAPFHEYLLRLELSEDSSGIHGISYIQVAAIPEVYARMALVGRMEAGKFIYDETEQRDHNDSIGWGWCLKHVELGLVEEAGKMRLEGPWTGYTEERTCRPGTIALERVEINPDSSEIDRQGEFGVVGGRLITHRKDIVVWSDTLMVYVWDGDMVDGDMISLQFNDEWLLRKHVITKTKKPFRLVLTPDSPNQIVLFADNQGQHPPNTAAITFFDGHQERNLSLSSGAHSCGALRFVLAGGGPRR